MHSKAVLPILILLGYLTIDRDIQAQGIPQACIDLNNNMAGDWYESQGTNSQLFPSHIRFIKQGPADGRFEGFGSPGFYSITEDCDAILVTDGLGRLIVAWGAQLSQCGLRLENWNRERLYCKGGPGQCPRDCRDCSPPGTAPRVEMQASAINQDNPKETRFTPLSGSPLIVYGGSIASTSDNLKLVANVTGCEAVKYTWSVTGAGASNYIPPSASSTASQWEIGDIKPVTGRLIFTSRVLLVNGQTIEAKKEIDVGIRTDDVMIIGWIDPRRVPLPTEGVAAWLTNRFRSDGTSTNCIGDVAWLSENFTTLDRRALTYIDRDYVLQWLFRYSANWDTLDSLAAGFTDSDGTLSPSKIVQFTSDDTKFKTYARLQVKYQADGRTFKGVPKIVNGDRPKIGRTKDPCNWILPPHSAQNGVALTPQPKISKDNVALIVDTSPDAIAVRAFNTLMGKDLPSGIRPKFWEDIGARIIFTPVGGTSPQVVKQPYPTYYEYRNGILHSPGSTNPIQSNSPTVNFWPNPYPFGTVKCFGLGGITPGGRCGGMTNNLGRLARDRSSRIPPYVAGFVKQGGPESGQGIGFENFDLFDDEVQSHQNQPLDEQLVAFRSLWKLTASERESKVRQLLTRDEVVAVPAAKELIRSHADNVGALIGKEAIRWSEGGQLAVLETLLEEFELASYEAQWLDIPRAVAWLHLSRMERGELHRHDAAAALDIAALILGKSENSEDHALLRRGIRISPQSRGLWIGIIESRISDKEEHAIALSVASDKELPLVSRVASALSIAPVNEWASKFAAEEVRQFMAQYTIGDQPKRILTRIGRAELNPSYVAFQEFLRLVGLLRFSHAGWESSLVLDSLDSPSEDIRMTAALIGGIRWPSEIIQAGRSTLSEEEYTNVLAFIALRHPELDQEIQRRFPTLNVQGGTIRIQRLGLTGVFGLPGSIAYGF